jgi:hypothetical protein
MKSIMIRNKILLAAEAAKYFTCCWPAGAAKMLDAF